jgi:hypothetical protein
MRLDAPLEEGRRAPRPVTSKQALLMLVALIVALAVIATVGGGASNATTTRGVDPDRTLWYW